MNLLPDWKKIATKAWSMRLMFVAVVLSVAEAALPFVKLPVSVPPGALAVSASVVGVAAMVARVMLQKKLMGDGDDQA